MADDVTKKILIDVKLKRDQLKSDIIGLNSDLDQLLIKQKKLSGANKQNTQEYIQLTSQIRLTKAEIRDNNKQVDNITKAINSENNSISQNRALLSVLTAQYVKLSQEEGKTAQSTTQLGTTIDGLTTKLKSQEKQIGQTYRNVGNYEEGFKSAIQSLGGFIPGFDRFNTAITTAVKGFGFLPNSMAKSEQATSKLGNTIGYLPQKFGSATTSVEQFAVKGEMAAQSTTAIAEAAPAAEEGLGAVGASAGLMTGVIAIAAAAIAGVVYYLSQLPSTGEKVEQVLAGIKAGFMAFGNDVAKGDFSTLADDIESAYEEAVKLTEGLQELNRRMDVQEIDVAQYDRLIAKNMLLLRNKKTTYDQAVQIDKDTKKLDDERVKEKLKNSREEYNMAVESAVNGKKISDQEKDRIKQAIYQYGLSAAQALEFGNKELNIKADQINKGSSEAIKKASLNIIQAEGERDLQDQKSQNRLDIIQQRFGRENAKMDEELANAKMAFSTIQSERIASVSRTLQITQDAFGRELSTASEHYRQLIFKEEQFIADQEKLRHKSKSPEAVKQYNKNIQYAKGNIDQLTTEQNTASEKLLTDHNRNLLQITQKAALDLRSIQIANIQDTKQREINAANNELASQQFQLDTENHLIQDNIRKIQKELEDDSKKKAGDKTKYNEQELNALTATLNEQYDLLSISEEKRKALIKSTQDKINEINRQAANQQLQNQDKVALLRAQEKGGKNNPFNSAEQDAKHKALLDEYNSEVSNKSLTDDAKLALETAYLDKDKELTEQNEKAKREIILNAAQEVSKVVFSYFADSIRSQAQYQETVLATTKEHELNNSSLTSAQKLAINNKYRKLEGQEKVKEFKANQKLAIAQAIINGALAAVKTFAELGWPAGLAGAIVVSALTTAEVVAISKQKPPAYASGGHFVSDGRGAVLPGYSKKDNVNAQLRSGEGVVVSEAMRNPYARNMISAINVAYGGRDFSVPNLTGRYAIGGIVTDGGNSNRYYAQPQEGTESLANHIAYSLINNFPPIYTDVKDINNQQAIKARTINRVNL